MPFADLHCDTISRLHQRRRAGETLGLRDGQAALAPLREYMGD